MIRVIAQIVGAGVVGGSPATITTNFSDTLVGSSGSVSTQIDFTKVTSIEEIKSIILPQILALTIANGWSPALGPGDAIIFM